MKIITLTKISKFRSLSIAALLLLFALPFNGIAQTTIFASGFEAADPLFTGSAGANCVIAQPNANLPRTGTKSGQLTGTANNTSFSGSIITSALIPFVSGNSYTITVWARVSCATATLKIGKTATATNAAMVALAGGDQLLWPGAANVTSTVYASKTVTFTATVTESKYVGFQVVSGAAGGCASQCNIDDITIVENVIGAPCNITGNNFCGGAGTPLLNGSCCSSTLNAATDEWAGLVGCQSGTGGNNEVWFTGTPAAGQNQLQFTINNLGAGFTGNVELVVVASTGPCSGFTMAGSFCGPAPVSYSLIVTPGTTYYWTVSSSAGSNGPTATFDICVTNNIYVDNSACNVADVLTANPLPTINATYPAGTYPPGTTVQFNYTITGWEVGASCNWLAAIVPSWGSGWDPASFVRTLNPVIASGDVISAPANGWSWWTKNPMTHNTTGANINPNSGAWVFCNDGASGLCSGTNTTVDWGDGCRANDWGHFGCNTGCDAVGYRALTWNVGFQLTTRATAALCTAASSDLRVNVKTYADGEIGSWTSIGCMADIAATTGFVQACCLTPASPLTWSGATTSWINTDNWGGCILPTCTNDIVIASTASNPTISTSGSCRNLTINAGATLTINAGCTLSICGDFVNNGTIVCAAGSTVSFIGTVAQSLGGSTTSTFSNLTINNTSATGVTLAAPANVSGALTLTDGIVYTTAVNILSVLNGGTSTAGSSISFVDGWMRKVGNQAFVFPLGDGLYWARLGISAPGGLADAFTATYNAAPYSPLTPVAAPNAYVSSIEHWICNRTAGASNVFVTLFWESGARSGINTFSSDLHVARYDGATWQDHGSGTMTGSAALGTIRTAAAVTAFSPFTFSSISVSLVTNPLPVELLNFSANYNGQSVDLNWKTASEKNNDYFNVERSTDVEHFTFIGQVASKAGRGNSTTELSYYLNDNNVKEGTYYYRLKQVDFNGKFNYSGIVSVVIDGQQNNVFSIKPNPTANTSDVIYHCNSSQNATINVYDSRGRMVIMKTINCIKGENVTNIDLSGQPEGIFYVTLTTAENVYKSKLLKTN